LGNGGHELAALTDEPLLLALETGDASVRNEILLPQLVDADELLADPFDLLSLDVICRLDNADLLTQLGHALAQLRLLAFPATCGRISN